MAVYSKYRKDGGAFGVHLYASQRKLRKVRPLWHIELRYIYRALVFYKFNQTQAAKALEIGERTMRCKVAVLISLGVEIPHRKRKALKK